jgi:hypothetical protein
MAAIMREVLITQDAESAVDPMCSVGVRREIDYA